MVVKVDGGFGVSRTVDDLGGIDYNSVNESCSRKNYYPENTGFFEYFGKIQFGWSWYQNQDHPLDFKGTI